MAKQKEEKKSKPLTGPVILQRVRGCGEAEAKVIIGVLKLTDEQLRQAYDKGGAAVLSLLDEAYDKALPPAEPKPVEPMPSQAPTPV